jgi:hypothetical protein
MTDFQCSFLEGWCTQSACKVPQLCRFLEKKIKMPSKRLLRIGLAATLCLGGVAFAQTALPVPSGPDDPDVDSLSAMKDTVNDPRIAAARAGNSWGMWDIGRPHDSKTKGAFDDHDPIGVAAGKLIPADCSFQWTDSDTHQIYCFSSQASLVYFLGAPKANKERAEKGWRALKGTS